MSAETDAVLAQFGGEINATTNEIAADIDALIASANSGASVAELTAALTPISENLKAVAAKYPVVAPPPPDPSARRR